VIALDEQALLPEELQLVVLRLGTQSYALDIAGAGLIVGASIPTADSPDPTFGFLWDSPGMHPLALLGGTRSFAVDINDRGQIVGVSQGGTSGSHGVLWQNGVITDLGTKVGVGGMSPAAINDRGQVVGSCGRHACLWDRGTIVDLGALVAGGDSVARAINNRGEIVGWSQTASGGIHAVRWNRGHIEDLEPDPNGFSDATAINARGQIVGFDNAQAAAWWNQPSEVKR